MEEIKVGEYVRWKGGSIRKVTRLLTSDETYIEIDGLGDIATYKWEMLKNMITKHSPNIIDLVEVGDYVNGHKIINIDTDPFISGQINLWTNLYEMDANGDRWRTKYIDKDIKSIVTKEQFENAEYKLDN